MSICAGVLLCLYAGVHYNINTIVSIKCLLNGVVFVQVFNGLMKRADWTTAIKKPVGYIPGGSGNALGCAINYAAGCVLQCFTVKTLGSL